MTPDRVELLKTVVKGKIDLILSLYDYDEIFVAMGKLYREVVMDLLPPDSRVVVAEGGIGEKSSALYHWLRRT